MTQRNPGTAVRSLMSVLAAAFLATATPPVGAVAQTSELTCNGHMRMVFLSPKPLKVNPGRCRYARINLIFTVQDPVQKPPPICLFAKAFGSAKEYGPFCNEGATSGMAMPGPIEWLWSNGGVETGLKFCKDRENCR
jgi:hypothetical protein